MSASPDRLSKGRTANSGGGGVGGALCAPSPKARRKRKYPYRKADEIEADIGAAETELRQLEELMASPDLYRDGERVKQTTRAFEEAKAHLHELYEHWDEAVELNGPNR